MQRETEFLVGSPEGLVAELVAAPEDTVVAGNGTIAFGRELPLFPKDEFGPILAHGQERTPGNTIRKVYLCRAKTTRIRPGDLLFFYLSKHGEYAAAQSITTVGVVEQVTNIA